MKKTHMLLDMMFWSNAQTHAWHLQTVDMDLHVILNEYYDEVGSFLDAFSEGHIGETGILPTVGNTNLQMRDFTTVSIVVEHMDMLCGYISEVDKETEGMAVNNCVKGFWEFIMTIKYKLRMTVGYKQKEVKTKDEPEEKKERGFFEMTLEKMAKKKM